MTRDRRSGPTGFEAFTEIGKQLGDLAEHLKTAFETAGSETETGDKSSQRTFTISTPNGPLTGVAGYSLRFGAAAAGRAAAGKAGTTDRTMKPKPAARPKPAEAEVDAAREPLVDLHDEAQRIVITAELPGVEIKDVSVQLDGRTLVIETHSARRFHSVVDLSADVEADTLAVSLRNGILQATIAKAKSPAGA